MAKKLNLDIEKFIDYRWVFLDLLQQLGNEIYRKDNYYAFNEICEWFRNDMEVEITGSYYFNYNSIDFKLVNKEVDRVYKIIYCGEEKMFEQMTIYDGNGKMLKDLELGNLVGIRF